MEQSFKKEERLCSKVVIDQLFADGNSFVINPIRTIWIENKHKHEHQYPAQVLIVVPKKNIPSAVKRNKIKRHMRECYRKNKEILYEGLKSNRTIALALIYTMNNQIIYQEMEKKIILSLRRLVEINEVDH